MGSWLVEQLDDASVSPLELAGQCRRRGCRTLFFDSQQRHADEGRYSIILTEPSRWLSEKCGKFWEGPDGRRIADPGRWMVDARRSASGIPNTPFVGGLAGYLGFEFGWALEDLKVKKRRAPAPDLWVGRFDHGAVFDHRTSRWSLVFRDPSSAEDHRDMWYRVLNSAGALPEAQGPTWSVEMKAPSRDHWTSRVQRGVDDIFEGEFFEVNYTERFHGTLKGCPWALYCDLRERAPGPYGGYVDLPQVEIASISPEQFMEIGADGKVLTRPIKGTRPRGASPEEDEHLARSLQESVKDRAENTMIVDLMRNDLTRVCQLGTVTVSEWCGLHSFASVHHLISTVEGRLDPKCDRAVAFLNCFPAGSITGAPKLRAMEWIASVEATARGPYTGSLFYLSDHGRLDSNVLIRTAVIQNGHIQYGSGGAVVSDSNPEQEYEEAQWKARPLMDVEVEQ